MYAHEKGKCTVTGDVKVSDSPHVTDAGAQRKESQTKRKRKISVDPGRLARTTC